MTPIKIYRPANYVSLVTRIVVVVFVIAPLLVVHGMADVILFEAKISAAANRPLGETASSMGLLFLTGILICAFLIFGIAIGLTVMAQIHVREDSLRVKTWFYQSEWLAWTAVQKVRRLPFSNNLQLGIVGLGWMFRLVALINWLPGGYVVVGSSLVDGEMLVKTIKQKRPDLFQNYLS